MKVSYKIEIHRRKGKVNDTILKLRWKNKKSDKWALQHIDFCCLSIKDALDKGFITIEITQQYFKHLNYNDRKLKMKEPTVCLYTMNENGWGDEGCPHQGVAIPIKHCPFCSTIIETELVEKTRITHEYKKVKRSYVECEDKTKVEVIG